MLGERVALRVGSRWGGFVSRVPQEAEGTAQLEQYTTLRATFRHSRSRRKSLAFGSPLRACEAAEAGESAQLLSRGRDAEEALTRQSTLEAGFLRHCRGARRQSVVELRRRAKSRRSRRETRGAASWAVREPPERTNGLQRSRASALVLSAF